jgi:nocardicin N-oxygenase
MGPPEEYVRLRESCPYAKIAMPMGASAWFVTRYRDVRELLADPRLVRPTINEFPPRPGEDTDDGPALVTLSELDGPRHTALRRAVAPEFSARSVRDRLPRIRELADHLLEPFQQGGAPGDLIAAFTTPFPLLVMCDLVGIPFEERLRFVPMMERALTVVLTSQESRRVTDLLREYAAQLIVRKRREPADDALTRLVRQSDNGELTHEDVLAFILSMLTVGFTPTNFFLANAVYALLCEAHKYALLHADRRILPTAVEEFVRSLPVMNGIIILLATEDVTVHGHTVRAGEAVLPVVAAANRDERVFTDADRLDLRRAENHHLGFGRGAHNCLGAHLARAELTVGLEALLDRFPRLRMAEGQNPTWDDESLTKAPLTLPVSW